jgi:restriction endonuclease S subunit
MIQITSQAASSTGKWKAYSDYKDSGVEWLGEIPEHWEVKRLKYIAPVSTTKLINKPIALPYLGLENIEAKTGRLLLDEPIENVDSAVGIFEEGNVLFGKLRPYLAKVAHVDFRGVCTTELMVFQPSGILDNKFLFYRLLSQDFIKLVDSMTYGTKMPRASNEQISNLFLQLPPLPEQRAIATFLDRETTKINALIAKKERLIELLREKRTALISHVVTKGLDSTVPMKDSGVEWLGEIPEHWKVRRLKHLATEALKYGANEPAEIDDINLPRYIRITDIDEMGSLHYDTFKSLPEEIAQPYLLKVGDLLFARSGATVGKSFMYQDSWGRACYAGYLIRARLNTSVVLPKFISYFTTSSIYWNWLASVFSQSTIQNVNAEKYSNLVVTVPPLSEQYLIVNYLDQETAKIDALVSRIQEGIEKLKEYSTALIGAAVMGKIDVRGETGIPDDEM